jgi:hypothetical protein
LYGKIFQDYISNYEFWGYCDIDLILGDLQSFLAKIDLCQFDRLFDLGHLTFYRNTSQINNLYTKADSLKLGPEFIFNTTIACNFDECGMNQICHHELGKRWYHELEYIDVNWWHGSFKSQGTDLLSYPQLFVHYPNGKLFHLIKRTDNNIEKREIAYIHCIKRSFYAVNDDILTSPYILTHKGIVAFEEGKVNDYFNLFESSTQENQHRRKEMKRYLHRALWLKFYNEVKYSGFRGLKNIGIKFVNR